jgi:hypothetical protein
MLSCSYHHTHHLLFETSQLSLCFAQLRLCLAQLRQHIPWVTLPLGPPELVLQLCHLQLQPVDELILGLPVDHGAVLDGTGHLSKPQGFLGLCGSRTGAHQVDIHMVQHTLDSLRGKRVR